MHRTLVALATTVAFCLALPAIAAAHHVDALTSTADCNGVTAQFIGFHANDGPVNWIVTVDGAPNRSGAFNAFSGNKTFTQAYSPGPLTGPAAHTVVFRADWPTRGSNNGTFTKTVTGCPTPPKPCPPTPPTPTPPAPCNCPPGPVGPAGPAGPPGTTTVITVVENHTTIVYRDLTCTSARVFHLRIAKRVPNDDRFRKADRGQRVVAASIQWLTKISKPGEPYREGQRTAKAKLKNGRLRADASFVGVVAPKGQVRVITEKETLANGHVLTFSRRQRLCLGRNGNMNLPPDIPQNGRPDGSTGDSARAAAAKAPKYRKAVI